MSSSEENKNSLFEAGVVGLTFSPDYTRCALSPNSHLIYIYDTEKNSSNLTKWTHIHTLDQHMQAVSGIKWHPTENKILSCSQDRTAFVWVKEDYAAGVSTSTETSVHKISAKETWVPQLVALDAAVKRGLMCCAWSKGGLKIYIGSAASNIAVGAYQVSDGWWGCRTIPCHDSTVCSINPHPTNDTLVATGSTDGTVAVIATTLNFEKNNGEKRGTILSRVQIPSACWVYDVAWSPSGDTIAVATHDSRIHILGSSGESGTSGKDIKLITSVTMKLLPMRSLVFVGENSIVCGGFDFMPILVEGSGEKWGITGKFTIPTKGGVAAGGGSGAIQSQAALARAQLQFDDGADKSGHFGGQAIKIIPTKHKNNITSIVPIKSPQHKMGDYSSSEVAFVSSAMDGMIVYWSFDMISPGEE
eukprot:Tbor_TRINITY_DN5362_c5_g1::TRINITY_DN5362_c5_g1_i1::g.5045::m.5045/K05757/ARPC1A_B; actin related protein 2/3 complex, subunit 1A/1B